jgi:hypothetical protein
MGSCSSKPETLEEEPKPVAREDVILKLTNTASPTTERRVRQTGRERSEKVRLPAP